MADMDETHVCDFFGCHKRFRKQSRLETHMRSHTGERPYICPYEGCMKSYTRVDHLGRHKQLCHDCDDSHSCPVRWTCDESDDCEATFSSSYALKKHVKQHHSKESYRCHVVGCGEVFRKHHQLKSHRLEQHHQGRAFCCSEAGCDKSFPTRGKLKRHQKTHEGYMCSDAECGRRFEKWTLLVQHRRVEHATVHKCKICVKAFSSKQWLKQHELTHASERQVFTCYFDNCERVYMDQRNLNAHIRSYHDGKRFPCEHEGCGKTFVTKQKQQHHMKLHDPNRPIPKKKKKTKTTSEKLTGASLETESRVNDMATFTLPDREDSIDLSDFTNLHTDSSDLENMTDPDTERSQCIKERVTHHQELMENIYQEALMKAKTLEKTEKATPGMSPDSSCKELEYNSQHLDMETCPS